MNIKDATKSLQNVFNYKAVKVSLYCLTAFLVLLVTYYSLSIFNVFGMNTYKDGWRAGSLSKYTVSNRIMNWLPFSFFPTGEGYILLGNNSSRISVNGHTISPSHFSSDQNSYEKFNKYAGKETATHFRQLRHTWFLSGETDIRVDKFDILTDAPMPEKCYVDNYGWFSKAYGVMGGKIVEAAVVGHPLLWNTYEVIIHTGGNEYIEMSVSDKKIYECAVYALKSGRNFKISYEKELIRDPITQATYYNLKGIE